MRIVWPNGAAGGFASAVGRPQRPAPSAAQDQRLPSKHAPQPQRDRRCRGDPANATAAQCSRMGCFIALPYQIIERQPEKGGRGEGRTEGGRMKDEGSRLEARSKRVLPLFRPPPSALSSTVRSAARGWPGPADFRRLDHLLPQQRRAAPGRDSPRRTLRAIGSLMTTFVELIDLAIFAAGQKDLQRRRGSCPWSSGPTGALEIAAHRLGNADRRPTRFPLRVWGSDHWR